MTRHRTNTVTGNTVKRVRTRLGYSQGEAAAKLRISQSLQSKLEGLGAKPLPARHAFVAHVYGCPACRRHFLINNAIGETP